MHHHNYKIENTVNYYSIGCYFASCQKNLYDKYYIMSSAATSAVPTDEQVVKVIADMLSDESLLWLAAANPAQISLALEAGIRSYNVFAVNTMGVSKLEAPPDFNWNLVEKSVERGKLAEQFIVDMLRDKFGKDSVADTSKTSKAGDITLVVGGMRTMIEIKNYRSKVSQAEVEKFQRDLWVRKPHAGLFISLNTEITGIDDEFYIRYERCEGSIIPCIYMVGRLSDTVYRAVLLLRQVVLSKQHLLNDVCRGEVLTGKIDAISDATTALTRYRNDMSENMTAIQKMMCKNWQDITSAECVIRDSVSAITEQLTPEEIVGADASIIDKFAPQNRDETVRMFEHIDQSDGGDSEWKATGKKLTHVATSVSLLFTKVKAEVSIPVEHFSDNILAKTLAMFGAKFKIMNGCVILPLEKDTLNAVTELV